MAVFVGGTGDANKLDDYEEGSWTPAVGTGSVTTISSARYTKVGNICTVSFYALGFSDNSSSNQLQFTGLPFTSDGNNATPGACFTAKISVNVNVVSYIGGSTTTMNFFDHGTGDYDHVRHNNINGTDTTHRIFAQVTYRTAQMGYIYKLSDRRILEK